MHTFFSGTHSGSSFFMFAVHFFNFAAQDSFHSLRKDLRSAPFSAYTSVRSGVPQYRGLLSQGCGVGDVNVFDIKVTYLYRVGNLIFVVHIRE